MTSERWEQINAAFSAVLDQEAPERAQYLDRVFTHDTALRDEVARLLRDAQTADSQGFLQAPAWIIDDIPLFLPDFRNGDSEYSRIEYIGHGGMGIVYRAYHSNIDKWVALKLSYTKDRERFRTEAQSMAQLRHPNIVTVHATGEYEGRPYFVMELIEGNPLNNRLAEFAERPRRAAELVEVVALAVHHAHQRRILHNDLKPANILLDEEGQPHVADFGLSTRLGQGIAPSATGAIEGTASYMSPEQAEGKEITTLSDVYGLGALLYTLLTGTPPFRGATVQETLQLVRNAIPNSPRALNPNVDVTLEAICLKCLNKDPAQRYTSANALAQELIRYRTGQEVIARPWTPRERIVAWSRRNIVEAGLVVAVIAIWIFVLVMAMSVAQVRKADLLKATMDGVEFTAKDLATAADQLLGHLSKYVETETAKPRLAEFVAQNNRKALQQILGDVCSAEPMQFATCYILSQDGKMLAHAPPAPELIDMDFSSRDYFRGAKQLGLNGDGGSYISRAYKGMSDNRYKFSISAPILDGQRHFLGVIVTSVATAASLGPVIPQHEGRKAALIAPEENPGPGNSMDRHLILIHPAYRNGDPIDPIEFRDIDKIRRKEIPPDDHYVDPVSAVDKEYAGRWIAGFAHVGNTRFVLVVQQPFRDAVSLESSTLWNLVLWSALASLVAVAIMAMVLWRWASSRRQRAPGHAAP